MIKFVILVLAVCCYAGAVRWPSRIVGGVETTIQALPHQIGLLKNNQPWCGGSILNSQWILTASHCVHGSAANVFTVCTEATNGDCSDGVVHQVDKVIEHPNYNADTQDNDFCLIKVKDTINNNAKAQPVVLATSEPATGLTCTVSGWGALASGGTYPDKLRRVDVPIFDRNICNDAQHYAGKITGNMICAGYEAGAKDSCQGDSGGPLVFFDSNSKAVQVGVVSWGEGCAGTARPGVYASVPQALSWIQTTIQG